MSFPKISKQSRYKATSGRLGSQFLKRWDKGLLIDRTAQAIGVKEPRVMPVPKSLTVNKGANHAHRNL